MGSRPTRRPRWAYDAPGGQLVEPPSAYAAAGFYSSERPPAQWANYLFHFTTAWTDYLAGPGWGSWERVSHGGSAPVFTGVTGLTVDPDDIRAGEGRLRYLMVGAETGPAPIVAASRTGREWVERPVPTGCTELLGACYVGDQFLVWGWGADARGRTWITDAHGGASSVLTTNDAAQWTEILPLAENLVHSAAWDGTNGIVLTYGTTRLGVAWSTDGGASWTSSIFTEASSLSTYGAAVVYDPDRARYIIGATGGEIGIFDPAIPAIIDETVLPDAPGSLRPHLHLGGGTCIAWASTEEDGTPLTKSLVWRSDDGGETWAEVELPVLPEIGASITDVTYADGVWLATTTAAPYLWRSDDGGATWERVQLPIGEESSWALHRAVYADGAVIATGLTWTVVTTRATGLAPDSLRVYSPEPGYLADAGYLRGRRIAATAPTDGQVLVWDAAGGLWVPGSTSGTSLPDPSALSPGHALMVVGGAWTVVDLYAGPGLPLVLAASTMEGDGTEKIKGFTPLVPFVSGRRYRINGVICVWTAAGAHLATIRVTESLLTYTGSAWAAIPSGETHIATSAGIDTYFARAGSTHTADELPGLFDDSGALSIAATPLSGQTIRVEFRGTVADFGASL